LLDVNVQLGMKETEKAKHPKIAASAFLSVCDGPAIFGLPTASNAP